MKPQSELAEQAMPSLQEISYKLCKGLDGMPGLTSCSGLACRPSSTALLAQIEALRGVLFPGFFGARDYSDEAVSFHVAVVIDNALHALPAQIEKAFALVQRPLPREEGERITRLFLAGLPEVQSLLTMDAKAAFDGDPAATCLEETILCYPGLQALTYHRLAHLLYQLGVPLLPRMIAEHAHGGTGIDLHPGADIGRSFFIDHGTGVVIGETAVIGDNVRIYQGVTLGAKSFPADEKGNPIKGRPRHPIIEDEVVIYAGATILGRVTVGRASVIGGGVWLTHSVPEGTILTQAKERSADLPPKGPQRMAILAQDYEI